VTAQSLSSRMRQRRDELRTLPGWVAARVGRWVEPDRVRRSPRNEDACFRGHAGVSARAYATPAQDDNQASRPMRLALLLLAGSGRLKILCLAAAISLNHQLDRPSRALVNYCA
jgi:hypothetical protein